MILLVRCWSLALTDADPEYGDREVDEGEGDRAERRGSYCASKRVSVRMAAAIVVIQAGADGMLSGRGFFRALIMDLARSLSPEEAREQCLAGHGPVAARLFLDAGGVEALATSPVLSLRLPSVASSPLRVSSKLSPAAAARERLAKGHRTPKGAARAEASPAAAPADVDGAMDVLLVLAELEGDVLALFFEACGAHVVLRYLAAVARACASKVSASAAATSAEQLPATWARITEKVSLLLQRLCEHEGTHAALHDEAVDAAARLLMEALLATEARSRDSLAAKRARASERGGNVGGGGGGSANGGEMAGDAQALSLDVGFALMNLKSALFTHLRFG